MSWWLIESALISTALCVLVAALCRWLRPSPAARHVLWVIVLAQLVAPPVGHWPGWTAPRWMPTDNIPEQQATVPLRPSHTNFGVENLAAMVSVTDGSASVLVADAPRRARPNKDIITGVAVTRLSLLDWLSMIWIAGAAAALALHLRHGPASVP